MKQAWHGFRRDDGRTPQISPSRHTATSPNEQAQGYVAALGAACDAIVTDGIRYRLYDGAHGFAPLAYANLANLKRPAAELFARLQRP